jgi:lactoylglutathione lyase
MSAFRCARGLLRLAVSGFSPQEITMKRFHVHLHVDDLTRSVAFYSTLFDAPPSRLESDYAKWMLDDPRINFAISTAGRGRGVDHLGFQAESEDELADLKRRAGAADALVFDEGATVCCYARSEKHWVTDPQGVAWEHYRTMDASAIFGQRRDQVSQQVHGLAARAAGRWGQANKTCCPSGD